MHRSYFLIPLEWPLPPTPIFSPETSNRTETRIHGALEENLPALTASFSSTTLLNIKRMYLDGDGVLGPSFPSRCRIFVARTVCSQSSMNSQRWAKPDSLLSGFSSMMLIIQSTMARLYSKPPWEEKNKNTHHAGRAQTTELHSSPQASITSSHEEKITHLY